MPLHPDRRNARTDAAGPPPPRRTHRVALATAALLLTVLAGAGHADDTEIFVQAIPPADPNVLFVIDTSRSMESELVLTEDYDPATLYDGDCDVTRVYYVSGDAEVVDVPLCLPNESRYVNADVIRCDAASQAMMTVGAFTDRFAQWDPVDERWEDLVLAGFGTPLFESRLTECQADFGLHGDGQDDDRRFPVDDSGPEDPGPWTDDPDNAFDWQKADSYTFYSGNYLNYLNGDRDTYVDTRMGVLRDVAEELVNGVGGMRIGLMRFSSDSDGGMVVHPVSDVDDPANRQALISAIANLQPNGDTPLAETLYEAQRYLSGSPVVFGLDSTGNDFQPFPSVPASRTGNDYLTPLTEQCQANYMVLLTDGLPRFDQDADDAIEDLIGSSCAGESCLDDLSQWMAQNDQLPQEDKESKVLTYTIGFFADDPLLLNTATAPNPKDPALPGYFTASDVFSLSAALSEVFGDIEASNRSFQSPAVSVDGYNRLVNSDSLYFSMFVPSGAPYWAGNIKKYRLADVNSSMEIVDANGLLAVGGDGVFKDEAQSFWADEADGADVTKGGVRNRLGTDRQIFTDLTFSGENVPLWLDSNRFSAENELITPEMLGVDEDEFEEMMDFLTGVDENGDPAPLFGDPLHSTPTLVNFGDGNGGTRLRMYVGTNDGYFHALDLDPAGEGDPMEDWAFIPSEFLGELHNMLDNDVQVPPSKAYGLDGPISFWIKDDDGDNVVESGETLYLFVAMRRGGRNYMAISIPGGSPSRPTLEWTLRGGVGDFAELGQSWSAATVARMEVNGAPRTVLVIGGGYDAPSQDPTGPPSDDSVGRAVFVVDALTGDRLWWAGPPDAAGGSPNLVLEEMTNSIPSSLTVIDSAGDGLADRLYVGDMGVRVWRFDVESLPNDASGSVFANLGDPTEDGNRRFYYPPSVSRVLDEVYGSFLTVSIGSGHRASPLSKAVADRFYMLRDPNVFAVPTDEDGNPQYPDPITEGALLDITTNVSPTAEQLNGTLGWVLRLVDAGEKSLATALTADSKIFFSTYLPETGAEPDCNLADVLGDGRLYTVDLVTGGPVLLDDPLGEDVTPEDRFEQLDGKGIPPSPGLIFTECDGPCLSEEGNGDDGEDGGEDGEDGLGGTGCENAFSQVTLLIGTQTGDPGICNAPVRTFWRQNRQ